MTAAPLSRLPGAWDARLIGIVACSLLAFGIAAVYGASSIAAVQAGRVGSWFALRQLIGGVLGVGGLLIAARVDYHVWQRLAWPLLGGALVLLLVPYMPGTGAIAPEINGARRWVDVGVVIVQPSEIAKFAAVVWVSMLATKKGAQIRDLRHGLLPFIVIVLPTVLLIVFEPDLSTAALLVLIVGIVLFTAGARVGHFLVIGLIGVPVVWREIQGAQYQLTRVLTFLSPGADAADSSWQVSQSLLGIGSGRWFGVGFGEGLQKLGYLPYAYSDFIFSTIGEEWGFVGGGLVVLLFALYIGVGLRIARTASDRFGLLLATGLTAMVGVTAILHIAVTLALVPTTGLPLPFVSYGRSNLFISLLATGVIVSIGNRRGASRARS